MIMTCFSSIKSCFIHVFEFRLRKERFIYFYFYFLGVVGFDGDGLWVMDQSSNPKISEYGRLGII